MKLPFRSTRTEDEELDEPVPVQSKRSLPRHEQRLMFESSTHWGRGLAILLGMVGTVITFLIILTVLPRPGNGNPFDSISNSLGSNSTVATPIIGVASGAGAAAGSLPTVGPRSAQVVGTGTPGPKWVAVASKGVPNVRVAPSTNNNPIGNLSPNRRVEVIGRSPDNAWLQIVWDNNQKAWVASDLMTITSGDAGQIPVVRGQ